MNHPGWRHSSAPRQTEVQSQSYFNDISVRSFIPSGAPVLYIYCGRCPQNVRVIRSRGVPTCSHGERVEGAAPALGGRYESVSRNERSARDWPRPPA